MHVLQKWHIEEQYTRAISPNYNTSVLLILCSVWNEGVAIDTNFNLNALGSPRSRSHSIDTA